MTSNFNDNKSSAEVNEEDPGCQTLLQAVKFEKLNEAKRLLSLGADVNLSDYSNNTSLHYAATNNKGKSQLSIMKQLLESGADVNAKNNDDKTPLHCLVEEPDIEVVQLLLESGAVLNARDNKSHFPLMYTAKKAENTEVVRLLLKFGFNVNNFDKSGRTLLHLAAYHNVNNTHFETIELLLNNGADVNARNHSGYTPFHLLLNSAASIEIVKLFLKFEADLKTNTEKILASSVQVNSVEIFQLLVDHGLEVKHARAFLELPLHNACDRNVDKRVIKFLVKNGANTDYRDFSGYTPLTRYLNFNLLEDNYTIKYLLKYSDVNRIEVPEYVLYRNYTQLCDSYNIIVQHIAKMQALDLEVELNVLDNILGRKEFNDYFEKCKEELAMAKNTKIKNCWITFFNLLVDSKKKLRKYAGNRDLVEFFKNSNWMKKFPMYGKSIKENVEKGMEIRKAFDESTVILSDCLPIFNPSHLIIRDILDFFNLKSYLKLAS